MDSHTQTEPRRTDSSVQVPQEPGSPSCRATVPAELRGLLAPGEKKAAADVDTSMCVSLR